MTDVSIGPINRVDSNTIECEIHPSSHAKKYFTGSPFKIRYDFDIQNVPESILVIPALTTVYPVAWISGFDVKIDSIDRAFYESLADLKAGYGRMLKFDLKDVETIVGGGIIENTQPTDNTGMLFTGGVDSTASYYRIQDKSPVLIGIKNSKYSESEWNEREELVREFAEQRGLDVSIAYSNLRSVLDTEMLNLEYEREIGRYWFAGIQYGIGYMGICAPITYQKGIGTLYQGSGYTQDPTYPTAQPYIVDHLSWSSSQCNIDAVKETRQDKLNIISAGMVDDETPHINCCGCVNCCSCEKCYRTILGFLVEGVDPQMVGFDVTEDITARIRSDLENRQVTLSELQLAMWRDTQSRMGAGEFPYGDDDFVEWFKNTDLERFADTSSKSGSILSTLFRTLPYPFDHQLYNYYRTGRSRAAAVKHHVQSYRMRRDF